MSASRLKADTIVAIVCKWLRNPIDDITPEGTYMTKKLHNLAHEIQRRLLSGGAARTMEPVLRDAWASLYRWHEEGEHVYP